MLRDGTTSKQHAAPRKSRSSKNATSIAAATIIVALLACVGIVAMRYVGRSPTHPPASFPVIQATATQPAAFAPPKDWKVQFASDFQRSQVDTAVWGTCYPWATAGGCTNYGNTKDRELEWYQPSQVQVSGGELRLVAQSEPTSGLTQAGAPMEYACRSGMITTFPSFHFQYGYIQVTAMIPTGAGLWPALWLAAANEKWPPEIDILEHWANKFDSGMYLHPLVGKQIGGHIILPDVGTGYHTFGLYWTKTSLAWYYDGQQVFETSTQVPQQPMYFIANLADDVAGPGTCSGTLHIKSVKVWQPPN